MKETSPEDAACPRSRLERVSRKANKHNTCGLCSCRLTVYRPAGRHNQSYLINDWVSDDASIQMNAVVDREKTETAPRWTPNLDYLPS